MPCMDKLGVVSSLSVHELAQASSQPTKDWLYLAKNLKFGLPDFPMHCPKSLRHEPNAPPSTCASNRSMLGKRSMCRLDCYSPPVYFFCCCCCSSCLYIIINI